MYTVSLSVPPPPFTATVAATRAALRPDRRNHGVFTLKRGERAGERPRTEEAMKRNQVEVAFDELEELES